MNWMPRLTILVLAAALPFVLVGCKPSPPTELNLPPADDELESHDHPETFAEAMEQLHIFKTEIAAAFEAGDPELAHDALHEVGHVLEDLPTLVAEVTEDEAERESVEQASEKLLDAYGKLDGAMHGGEEVTYDSVEAEIDDGFATLDAVQNE